MALGLAGAQKLGVADRYRDHPDQVLLLLANDLISRAIRDASGKSLPSGGRNETSDQLANCDIQRPAAAFLSGSNSACTENGFVRNAMHPVSSAAFRTAGSSFPVM